MESLEFVEARPCNGSRGVMSGKGHQALDGIDVTALLVVIQSSPGAPKCGQPVISNENDDIPFLALEKTLTRSLIRRHSSIQGDSASYGEEMKNKENSKGHRSRRDHGS